MTFGKTLFAAVLACALVTPAFADEKKDAPAGDKPAATKEDKPKKAAGDKGEKKAKGLKGKVVKVDGEKLVILSGGKEGKEVTIVTNASTKVTIEGKEAKLADLAEGQVVAVSPAEGTAETIVVAAPKPKKDKADAGAAKPEGAKKDGDKAAKTGAKDAK